MAIKRHSKLKVEFSMSSMTDIVFLLLVFFLVTSTLVNPNALRLLLPKSSNQISEKAIVSVSIKHYLKTNTFSYHINGVKKPVEFDQIEEQLQGLLQDKEDPTITLCVDETVPMQQVVQVMNIAKRNSYKIILATSPE